MPSSLYLYFFRAHKTSSAFPGSVVLTQNLYGHTSLSASSACTRAYVHAYFQNGTLPGDGTVCEVESEMFPTSSTATGSQRRSFWDYSLFTNPLI
ncbi:uncharacterized protein EV420DRAFT_1281058 [Desarmillaria tabescens]|uniref:Peptidase S33 tripeptidyl aminopeptidase-like C-terminal domain-containing protein n=1 Tax=Armillaria tabescens TaxID=1929756 RepID=A0AA39J704_ARMTA|nr:uncharacterized protein EV420DRAFT_1281058 [Desarmillaria tabescens]KAK0436829.1 hypothetical protein EV420DRAFT_1281058 [Desarmillaria tabescens]